MSTMLEVKNLHKSFGDKAVLKGIDFSLEKGEVLAIIGSSGGGKTTLLRCLNFLEFANEGQILINGEVIYDGSTAKTMSETEMKKCRLHFGLVFQSFNLFPQYSVIENIMLAPKLLKIDSNEAILAKAEELLKKVNLEDKRDYYPCQLSGGQQQRVAIARALALNPDILCFDEPTSALDPELTGEVLRVIRGLKNGDSTMIIVTHEMEFAKNVADKVIFIDSGVIEEMGTPKEVFENPSSERTKAFLKHSLENINGEG